MLLDDLHDEQLLRKSQQKVYDWPTNARPEQMLPPGSWRTWLILAGRGFGKTRTGSETIKMLVGAGLAKRIGIIADSDMSARHVMIEGNSGLLSVYPPKDTPRYCSSNHQILWECGAVANIFSAERPDQLRGPQFDFVWIDELSKFRYGQEVWDQVQFCLRLGDFPRAMITTTPRPIPLIKSLMEHEETYLTRGSTFDNKDNLPPSFLRALQETYGNTSLGMQEIEGQFLEDEKSLLWHKGLFKEIPNNISVSQFENTVIAVDPAVSCNKNSDETGIIVAAKDSSGFGYVLADLSGKYTPEAWAQIVVNAFYKYSAKNIIVENNQGGDLVLTLIKSIDKSVPVKPVRATASKKLRAEPVSVLYHKHLIHHAPMMCKLEKQLLEFATISKSPDRVDALVWALSHLFYSSKPHAPKIWLP